ncbi:Nucleoside-diphosphate-sugar epimerase [Frankia sp. AiPs1]|uniref:NAD-dependent epimerase/dehydratase family protein n=1 Tax=Frankia sp. AiPa1 TaxID=573492 RepID=UPI00202B626A|nr:NAD-dependent epimerase/dehydratase family protein [Frankia sp. AiPa1]MCL9760016.1 NAD-dependent epimerase/dehydratase family protein [Frankia sp. AiPa1]
MHLLILGGTRFVGRAVVDAALAAGAEVTLFNRGLTAPGLFPQLETVLGDRSTDLSALAGRRFDLVIDCAGYEPAVVARSVAALGEAVDRYVFVSSVSVYADQTTAPVEGAVVREDDSYGGRKAACERIVLAGFGDRALIARSGLLVGPHDPTERFAYWTRRFTRGGPVLAPGHPADPAQFLDVRDLGAWLVDATASGIHNAVGLSLPMGELLDVCRTVAGSNAPLVWRSTADLLAAGVAPWMGVPLWIGDPAWSAANLVDGRRARAHGLRTRPIVQTVTDVATWDAARGGPLDGREPLPADDERRLLLATS